jgi:hypothetical protein
LIIYLSGHWSNSPQDRLVGVILSRKRVAFPVRSSDILDISRVMPRHIFSPYEASYLHEEAGGGDSSRAVFIVWEVKGRFSK